MSVSSAHPPAVAQSPKIKLGYSIRASTMPPCKHSDRNETDIHTIFAVRVGTHRHGNQCIAYQPLGRHRDDWHSPKFKLESPSHAQQVIVSVVFKYGQIIRKRLVQSRKCPWPSSQAKQIVHFIALGSPCSSSRTGSSHGLIPASWSQQSQWSAT